MRKFIDILNEAGADVTNGSDVLGNHNRAPNNKSSRSGNIRDNKVNRSTKIQVLQSVMKRFFLKELPGIKAGQMSKNPRDYLLKKIQGIDDDFSYDSSARKLSLPGDGINKSMVAGITSNESVFVESVDQSKVVNFAMSIGLGRISDQAARDAAKRWPEFINAIKDELGWDYGIKYRKPVEPKEVTPRVSDTKSPIDSPIDPVKKGMFSRGVEFAGRKLKDAGGRIAGSIKNQDPYNPNSNRDPFKGAFSKSKSPPNKGKIFSKEVESRLKNVQSRMNNVDPSMIDTINSAYSKLRDEWIRVKTAIISNPTANRQWMGYVNSQLGQLEKHTGISPGAGQLNRNLSNKV